MLFLLSLYFVFLFKMHPFQITYLDALPIIYRLIKQSRLVKTACLSVVYFFEVHCGSLKLC